MFYRLKIENKSKPHLQQDGETVEFHAELAQMLVFPDALILTVGRRQHRIHITHIPSNQLLNVLLYVEHAVHVLEGQLWPVAPVLQNNDLPDIKKPIIVKPHF